MSGTPKTAAVPVESVDDLVAFLRAGEKPPAESNGISYLKNPLDAL